MKNKTLVLLLFLSCPCLVKAQEYRIKGVIIPIYFNPFCFSARTGLEYIQKNILGYSIEYTYTAIPGLESENSQYLHRTDLLLHKYLGKKPLDRSFFLGLGLHYRFRKFHYESGLNEPGPYESFYHATGLRILLGKRIYLFNHLGLEISESIGIENGFLTKEYRSYSKTEKHQEVIPVFRFNLLFSYKL